MVERITSSVDITPTVRRFDMSDSLTNLVANLGTGNGSKLAGDSFGLYCPSDVELESMYRGDWMSRKIVKLPVLDALRPGRDWQAGGKLIERMEAAEKRHNVRRKVAQAATWARLYGGSAILISNGDNDPAEPLRQVRKGGLQCLTVLQRVEIEPEGIVRDPRSPQFREPEHYMLNAGDGVSLRVHHSRVIRLVGAERPDVRSNETGWGDSILQIVYDAIHHAALTSTAIAELVHGANIDVIAVKGLSRALSSTKGTEELTRRFETANRLKAINRLLLLDEGETYERKQIAFAALPDVLKSYMQIVAGASDIPAMRFHGETPSGLNASGDGSLVNYYDMLDAYREDELRPVYERLDEVLWQDEVGTVPTDAYWTFAPLWQMPEKEAATVAKTKAETTQIYANLGVFGEDSLGEIVANQLVEDGTYPGIEAVIAKIQSARPSESADPEPENAPRTSADRAIERYLSGYRRRP